MICVDRMCKRERGHNQNRVRDRKIVMLSEGLLSPIVLILYDNLITHACRKIGLSERKKTMCDCFRYNQKPLTDLLTEIAPEVRTYF